MRSPTNRIVTAIASVELISATALLVITHLTVAEGRASRGPAESYSKLVSYLIPTGIFMLFHVYSLFLTVILAAWRYTVITYPLKAASLCTMRKANILIILTLTVTPALIAPGMLLQEIQEQTKLDGKTWHKVVHIPPSLPMKLYVAVIALVQCFMMTALVLLTFALVIKLIRINKRRRNMSMDYSNDTSASTMTATSSNRLDAIDHTNRCLVAIIVCFLISEIPTLVIHFLNWTQGPDFVEHVFQKVVFLVDLTQVTVGTINFSLMLSMSQQFRDTFFRVFRII